MGNRSYGPGGLKLEVAGELLVDRKGLWSGSCVFTFPAKAFDLIPKMNSVHPYASFLFAERMRIIMAAGLWKVSVDYVGIDVDTSDPQYELSPGTGNEAVETHPDFSTLIAGTPNNPNPDTKPIFRDPVTGYVSTDNATAEFDRFSLGGELAGVTSYIAQNNTVWTKSWTQKTKPTAERIRIVTAPPGDAPNYGGNFNWLQMPVRYSVRARVFSCSQSWLCSGPQGWKNLLYPDP